MILKPSSDMTTEELIYPLGCAVLTYPLTFLNKIQTSQQLECFDRERVYERPILFGVERAQT